MAAKVAFFLVLALYVSGEKIPGRFELTNPDVETARGAGRVAAKRTWFIPSA